MPFGLLGGLFGGGSGGSSSVQPVSQELIDLVNGVQASAGNVATAFGAGSEANIGAITEGLGAFNAFGDQALGILGGQSALANNALTTGASNALAFQEPLLGFTNQGAGILGNLVDRLNSNEFNVDPFEFNFDESSPEFQFLTDRGNGAVNAGANAAGLLNSGGRARELATFNQGLANTFRSDELNRQLGVFNANRAANSDNLQAAGVLGNIGNNLLNTGVGAANTASNISNQLGINQANNFNALGQNSANVLTGLGAGNLGAFEGIGGVLNQGILGAANANNQGLLSQIDALTQIESIQRSNQQLERQNDQSDITGLLGGIGSLAGLFI